MQPLLASAMLGGAGLSLALNLPSPTQPCLVDDLLTHGLGCLVLTQY